MNRIDPPGGGSELREWFVAAWPGAANLEGRVCSNAVAWVLFY